MLLRLNSLHIHLGGGPWPLRAAKWLCTTETRSHGARLKNSHSLSTSGCCQPQPLLPYRHKPNSKTAANPSVTKKRTATTTTTTTTTNSTPIWNFRRILPLITLPKWAQDTVNPEQRREKPYIYSRRGVSRNLIRPPTRLNSL